MVKIGVGGSLESSALILTRLSCRCGHLFPTMDFSRQILSLAFPITTFIGPYVNTSHVKQNATQSCIQISGKALHNARLTQENLAGRAVWVSFCGTDTAQQPNVYIRALPLHETSQGIIPWQSQLSWQCCPVETGSFAGTKQAQEQDSQRHFRGNSQSKHRGECNSRLK